eukprot:scaffold240000_cov35-Tisochrysis_lutea.AAC.1
MARLNRIPWVFPYPSWFACFFVSVPTFSTQLKSPPQEGVVFVPHGACPQLFYLSGSWVRHSA